MSNILIIYLIISVYLFIGYLIHCACVKEIYNDNYYGRIYDSLSDISKKLIMVLIMFIWLPITIGEVTSIIFKWFIKNY